MACRATEYCRAASAPRARCARPAVRVGLPTSHGATKAMHATRRAGRVFGQFEYLTSPLPRPTSCAATPTSLRPTRRCCRRSGSNETRPGHRRPKPVRLRQGLPARLPTQGARAVPEIDPGLPDQPGVLPWLPDRGRGHRPRPSRLRALRPGPPEGLADLDARAAPLRAQDDRAAADRDQDVPGLQRPRGHHPDRAQPGREGPAGPGQSPNTNRVPDRAGNPGRCWPRTPASPRSHGGTGCC